MAAQLDMFAAAPIAPAPTKPSIDERFEAFHKANPHVFAEMKRLAYARLARGETRIAVKALWEELRTSLMRRDIAENGDAERISPKYKLNNSYTALYARMLVEIPEFATAIELRARKGKK